MKPWVFYCPCCQLHYTLTIGATTGRDVVTELSPISNGINMALFLWMRMYLRRSTGNLNEKEGEEGENGKKEERPEQTINK